jgi:lysine biosynthesis protein LysW
MAEEPPQQEGSDTCPECGCDLELEGYDFDVGETINCPECSIEVRIVSVSPLLVVLADGE